MAEFLENICGIPIPDPILSIFSILFVLLFIVFFIDVCRR